MMKYTVALVCLFLTSSLFAQSPMISAKMLPTCAPYDGPALSITYMDPQLQKETILSMNIAPSAAQGRFALGHFGKPEGGRLTFCTGVSPSRTCEYADTGTVSFSRIDSSHWTVTIDATYTNTDKKKTRYARVVAAELYVQGRVLCG